MFVKRHGNKVVKTDRHSFHRSKTQDKHHRNLKLKLNEIHTIFFFDWVDSSTYYSISVI